MKEVQISPIVSLNKKNKFKFSTEPTKRILFICETAYQLFNVIQIKYQMYPDTAADLLLTKSTNIYKYRDILVEKNLFDVVYQSDFCESKDNPDLMDRKSRSTYVKSPRSYKHIIHFPNQYTDYFMSVLSSPYQALVYYGLVSQGMTPQVHIFEEGSINYTEQPRVSAGRNCLNHSVIPKKKRLINNIKEIIVRKPEQYVANKEYTVSGLPNIVSADLKELLFSIYGTPSLPDERYIYFAEPFDSKGLTSNDVYILDNIADFVGKENIIVKLHPRCEKEVSVYSRHGYKILDTDAMWETMVLKSDITRKVLLSVSSNTLNTPWSITGESPFVIYLFEVMKLSVRSHVREPLYRDFLKIAEKIINKNEIKFFKPKSNGELIEIIKYIKGAL